MIYLIQLATVLIFLVILAGVIGLTVLHIAFAFAIVRRSPDQHAHRYGEYIGRRITRRRVLVTLVVVPFALLALLTLTAVVEAHDRTSRLRSSLMASTSMRIRTGGNCHRNPEREILLLEAKDGRTIEDLLNRVSLLPGVPGSVCRCCGDMSFEFYEGTRMIESFSVHHDKHIRIQGDWFGDRNLSSSSRQSLSAWLAQLGVTAKLAQFTEQQRKEIGQGMSTGIDRDSP